MYLRDYRTPQGVPAVLGHCFLGHSGAWKGLIGALQTPLDAVAFDLPGHGRSPMPPEANDLQAQVAEQLAGIVTQPSLLIGHSFGGAALLRFALRHPARVRGLVLIEPVFIAAAMVEPGFEPSDEDTVYALAAREGRLEEAARLFYAYNDPTRDWDALPEPAKTTMIAQMRLLPATEPGVVADSGNLLEPGLMEGFAPPVLLIGGSHSPPLFPAVIRALSRRLRHARVARIEGAGHMLPVTHAEETAHLIDIWLRDTGLATGPD